MRDLIAHLRRHGERPAVHTAETTVSYRALAGLVETAATELGGPRKLVLLETRNDIDTLYVIGQCDRLWQTYCLAPIALEYCTLLHLHPSGLHQ